MADNKRTIQFLITFYAGDVNVSCASCPCIPVEITIAAQIRFLQRQTTHGRRSAFEYGDDERIYAANWHQGHSTGYMNSHRGSDH